MENYKSKQLVMKNVNNSDFQDHIKTYWKSTCQLGRQSNRLLI